MMYHKLSQISVFVEQRVLSQIVAITNSSRKHNDHTHILFV